MASPRAFAIPRGNHGEHGQSLPLLALALVALCGLVGFAIDVGRIYAARTELTRSLDAGALAGVQELPNMGKAKSVAASYVAYNDPTAFNITAVQEGSDARLRVSASRQVPMTFLKVLGMGDVIVTQAAVAGLGTIPIDVVMAIDTTGSMGRMANGSACPSSNANGCKMKEAKDAAKALTNVLLTGSGSASTAVGLAPFSWCYHPTNTNGECVRTTKLVPLTTNNGAMTSGISTLSANGKTNICEGLVKAEELLFGAGARPSPPAFKALVLLSDGANTFADDKTVGECMPNTLYGSCCSECPGNAMTGDLDRKTYAKAQELKAAGVDIYVVALGLCGSKNTNTCNPTKVGSYTASDYPSNLLKCVASSLPGSNDHFFATDDPTELTEIFENIARLLALRLIE